MSISVFSFARAMTSTAVVEIIDLTDAQASIDDDTQNIPKSETRETDADPEKSTARAARKRKNGEAGTSKVRSSHPAESRRVSVERDRVQSGEGAESHPAEDSQGKGGESARKKKRRSKKGKDKDKDSAPSSREDAQQDELLALDDDKLFFVDTEPTSVPVGMTFVLNDDAKAAQSSSQTSEVDKVPLLLPAHVSVLDTGGDLPVQIVQPADSDSDTESYIEYLDYDDRLVRHSTHHPCCGSVAHSKIGTRHGALFRSFCGGAEAGALRLQTMRCRKRTQDQRMSCADRACASHHITHTYV